MVRKLVVVVVVLVCGVAVQGAGASPPKLGDFVLRPGATGAAAQVAALDGQLHQVGVQWVLDHANRQATAGAACSAPAFGTNPAPAARYCFNAEDEGKSDDSVEWIPQGVTTVADAQQDQLWGDHQALLVSWYDKRFAPAKGVRISFLNPATNRYQNVLLVYPTSGGRSYAPVDVHAGGILWYGNYLYVVDTQRGIRTFDLRHIYDLTQTPGGDASNQQLVGHVGARWYGFGYRYVLPQSGAWVNDAGPDYSAGYDCPADGAPSFSYISLDRSTVPDRAITGQYCTGPEPGRVAAWPLNGGDGTFATASDGRVHASAAWRLPKIAGGSHIQGAATYNNIFYLSRSRGATTPGQLLTAQPKGANLALTGPPRPAAIGPEDLSIWPGQNTVWSISEHAGLRVLYASPL